MTVNLGLHVTPGHGGFLERWDSVQNRLILYRDSQNADEPGVLLIKNGGSVVPIYPMRDLPNSLGLVIWNVAGTPGGGVAIAAVARYSPQNVKPVALKSFLLAYDDGGTLRKLWDLSPCEPHYLAVDAAGEIFGLGYRATKATNYPLLVKYSPDGEVLGEFLPAKLFPQGDNVVLSASPTGESDMFIQQDTLFVWLAPQQELLRLSLSGELQARVSLSDALKRVREEANTEIIKVKKLGIDASGQVVIQAVSWDKTNLKQAKFGFIRVSADGGQAKLTAPFTSSPTPGNFLGVSTEGKLVFGSVGKDPTEQIITSY
jgi:hypothetical protein